VEDRVTRSPDAFPGTAESGEATITIRANPTSFRIQTLGVEAEDDTLRCHVCVPQ